jgi:hypothetical protein
VAATNRDESDRLTWRPLWHGPCEAWAKKFVGKNLWRIGRQFDYDDAVQQCAVTFLKCCRFYKGKVDNDAHFMALFKRAVINDFHTFARHNRQIKQTRAAIVELYNAHSTNIELPDAPLSVAVNQASAELREVFRVIANGPSELVALMLDWPVAGLRKRPSSFEPAFSRSLCRLARVHNVRSDLVSELRILLDT